MQHLTIFLNFLHANFFELNTMSNNRVVTWRRKDYSGKLSSVNTRQINAVNADKDA